MVYGAIGGDFLGSIIFEAIKSIDKLCISIPLYKKMIDELFDVSSISIEFKKLDASGLECPSLDKIFHKVKINRKHLLIPASNMIKIVICQKLTHEPILEELEKMTSRMTSD